MVKFPTKLEEFLPPQALTKVLDLLSQPQLTNAVRETLQKVGLRDANPVGQVQDAWRQARGWFESVVERVMEQNQASPAAIDRAQAVGGDFFHEVPSGHDAYLLKHIIHDWNDANCQRILQAIRTACHAGTTLLVCEMVIPPGDEPHPGKLLDLEMLVVASGQERTEPEYQKLLSSRGFRLERILSLQSPLSIVEAVAV